MGNKISLYIYIVLISFLLAGLILAEEGKTQSKVSEEQAEGVGDEERMPKSNPSETKDAAAEKTGPGESTMDKREGEEQENPDFESENASDKTNSDETKARRGGTEGHSEEFIKDLVNKLNTGEITFEEAQRAYPELFTGISPGNEHEEQGGEKIPEDRGDKTEQEKHAASGSHAKPRDEEESSDEDKPKKRTREGKERKEKEVPHQHHQCGGPQVEKERRNEEDKSKCGKEKEVPHQQHQCGGPHVQKKRSDEDKKKCGKGSEEKKLPHDPDHHRSGFETPKGCNDEADDLNENEWRGGGCGSLDDPTLEFGNTDEKMKENPQEALKCKIPPGEESEENFPSEDFLKEMGEGSTENELEFDTKEEFPTEDFLKEMGAEGSTENEPEFDSQEKPEISEDEAKERLKLMFKVADANEDKSISLEELQQYGVVTAGDTLVENMMEVFKDVDKNNDSEVSWEEYTANENTNTYFSPYGSYILVHMVEDPAMKKIFSAKMLKRFQAADKDKDKKLSLLEFVDLMEPQSDSLVFDAYMEDSLDDFDKDGDGLVSMTEYLGEEEGDSKEDPQREQFMNEQRKQFKGFDKDQDGKLDVEELKAIYQPEDIFISSQRAAEQLMKDADENKDGKLSLQEMLKNYVSFVSSEITQYGKKLPELLPCEEGEDAETETCKKTE